MNDNVNGMGADVTETGKPMIATAIGAAVGVAIFGAGFIIGRLSKKRPACPIAAQLTSQFTSDTGICDDLG